MGAGMYVSLLPVWQVPHMQLFPVALSFLLFPDLSRIE